MIHIGICDDDLIFSDYLQTKIEQFLPIRMNLSAYLCFPPESNYLQWIFPL